jgi:hypothetical protein
MRHTFLLRVGVGTAGLRGAQGRDLGRRARDLAAKRRSLLEPRYQGMLSLRDVGVVRECAHLRLVGSLPPLGHQARPEGLEAESALLDPSPLW